MKCVVCNKEFEGEVCPRCEYPVIHTPNYDDYISKFKDTIDNFRNEFLNNISVNVVIHYWEDKDGVVVNNKKSVVEFNKIGENSNKCVWSDIKFARIPDVETIDIEIELDINGEKTEKTVSIPNITEPGLQKIGISVIDSSSFCMLLCNDNKKQTQSQVINLFD